MIIFKISCLRASHFRGGRGIFFLCLSKVICEIWIYSQIFVLLTRLTFWIYEIFGQNWGLNTQHGGLLLAWLRTWEHYDEHGFKPTNWCLKLQERCGSVHRDWNPDRSDWPILVFSSRAAVPPLHISMSYPAWVFEVLPIRKIVSISMSEYCSGILLARVGESYFVSVIMD